MLLEKGLLSFFEPLALHPHSGAASRRLTPAARSFVKDPVRETKPPGSARSIGRIGSASIPLLATFGALGGCGTGLTLTLGGRAGNRVRAVYPATQVDQAATVRAERKRWQLGDRRDLDASPAGRTPPLDHQFVPVLLELVEDVVLEVVEAAAVPLPVSLVLTASLLVAEPESGDFSAFAPFLYDSLR